MTAALWYCCAQYSPHASYALTHLVNTHALSDRAQRIHIVKLKLYHTFCGTIQFWRIAVYSKGTKTVCRHHGVTTCIHLYRALVTQVDACMRSRGAFSKAACSLGHGKISCLIPPGEIDRIALLKEPTEQSCMKTNCSHGYQRALQCKERLLTLNMHQLHIAALCSAYPKEGSKRK
ncbi:Hypothetical predicted protein [Scomber scombrus]|uniref:Uncharacterized protein n=1 Tax=Scomber scombrus TaxID=13677 RepID=A0AAV1P7F2_SCOSC